MNPIGDNAWAAVAKWYKKHAKTSGYSLRDLESLQMKFDRSMNIEKPTDFASCKEEVQRAKHISRDTLGKVSAVPVGGLNSNTKNNESDTKKDVSFAEDSTYGAMVCKKIPGTTGVAKKDKDDVLVNHVGNVSKTICSLVENC